jgi:hypothetical protein
MDCYPAYYTPSPGYLLPPVRVLLADRFHPHPAAADVIMNSSSNNQVFQNDPGMALNVHLAVPQAEAAAAAAASHTPNTPEILNSIVNMQNGPFAGYQVHQGHQEGGGAAGAHNAQVYIIWLFHKLQ